MTATQGRARGLPAALVILEFGCLRTTKATEQGNGPDPYSRAGGILGAMTESYENAQVTCVVAHKPARRTPAVQLLREQSSYLRKVTRDFQATGEGEMNAFAFPKQACGQLSHLQIFYPAS